ncbi:SOS response-associated peptidase [uncultured Amnibacterium sp.]|uniref:SOS response-associated peptidase n=1 Tax=uncultured Amnibacterium sp. TaxID=1631851 RepID=UPI0035CA7C14
MAVVCGRYVVTRAVADLLPDLLADSGDLNDDYNVAPTALVPVVRERHEQRAVTRASWGFLPGWAKDARAKPQPINARLETVGASGMFRRAFAQARCVVPAIGYYEWTITAGGKQPHFIGAPDAALAMAGVLSAWADPALPRDDPDRWRLSMAIITRDAHVAPGEVHDRMPACLTPDGYDEWLRADSSPDQLLRLLEAESMQVAETLTHYEVDRAVGNVRNNSPDLIRPLATG